MAGSSANASSNMSAQTAISANSQGTILKFEEAMLDSCIVEFQ
jgi:hypothetical protein